MDTLGTFDQIGSVKQNALRHEVVVHLLKYIFQGTIPPGSQLIIRKLAAQMGVSATPIREALLELEAIGVVQFVHNRGAVVKPFGVQQVREIYHVRRILEVEAVRCACGRAPLQDLQDLKRDLQLYIGAKQGDTPASSEKMMAIDRRLHELIAIYCGDARLADEIRRYVSLMQTIREIVGNRQYIQQHAAAEHLPIVDALLTCDANAAAEAMARHINNTADSVVAIMFQGDR
jgi:DNA-binding GntR family transcriptional regulator